MLPIIIVLSLLFSGISEADELWTKYDLPDTINCITNYGDYIWMGTENGVIKMNRNNGTQTWFTSKKDSLAEKYINYIVSDKEGKIFAGSQGQGIFPILDQFFTRGGISVYNGELWKIYKKGIDGLLGNDIKGISVDDDNKIWVALNDRYYTEPDSNYLRYYITPRVIQYFDNSGWQVNKIVADSIKAQGNWGAHFYKQDIEAFDLSDAGFYLFSHHYGEFQTSMLVSNNAELWIQYQNAPFAIFTKNIKIENKNNGSKRIWITAIDAVNYYFSNSIKDIIYGEYTDRPIVTEWKVLEQKFDGFVHCSVNLIIDHSNNKWFVDRDESNNKYLIKYDDINYIPYSCPSWTDSTVITCIYADYQGFIWVGTQSDGLFRFDAQNATIVQAAHQTPTEFTISSPYPNPFNAKTTISFTLTKPTKLNLSIYSLTGQKVRELAAGNYSAGKHTVTWDGKNEQDETVSSGLYLARMESGGASKVVRMVMVK